MSTEYFDLGGAERPTQPREPDITEADLDALRARLRAEVEEESRDFAFWQARHLGHGDAVAICVAAGLLMQGEAGAARCLLQMMIDKEIERREREEL